MRFSRFSSSHQATPSFRTCFAEVVIASRHRAQIDDSAYLRAGVDEAEAATLNPGDIRLNRAQQACDIEHDGAATIHELQLVTASQVVGPRPADTIDPESMSTSDYERHEMAVDVTGHPCVCRIHVDAQDVFIGETERVDHALASGRARTVRASIARGLRC